MTYGEACEKMYDRNCFGMMIVASGDADALLPVYIAAILKLPS